jgi:catechol 2,3-dioxygenase-like lactoylglutathione lyase family enzyme
MAEPDLVGIVVKDMAAALRFYRTLGLDVPVEADSEAHVEYVTPGGFRLAWDTLELMKSLEDSWTVPSGHRMGLAFKCQSPDEVDKLYERVIKEGYQGHKPPWNAFWGQRYAVVVDPDGNLIDLFASLEA